MNLSSQQSNGLGSASSGAFSTEQVERGRDSFLRECMDCHEIEEFVGEDAYLDQQEGENLWNIFEFIWSEMPEDKPAWLEPDEYADILAYLLDAYGFATGSQELPIDRESLEKYRVRPPGSAKS